MKILFLSHRFYPDIGGIEVNSEILAEAFSAAGHKVRLLTWSEGGEDRKFHFVVKRKPAWVDLIREHQWADVVFENNPCLRLAWPALLLKKTSVVALRTWISRSNGDLAWQDRLKLNWLKRAGAVIAVSDAVRRKCWPEARVIGNPFRSNLFRIQKDVARSRDFVFLGRLVSDKGVDLAIKAIGDLRRAENSNGIARNVSLTIVGDGPDRERLESLVSKLCLENLVRFAGALSGEALVTCMNEHRFIVVPSLWEEPFGNVALEGMACGCVPIVSDGGGLPDAVGPAGMVFPRGSEKALADCMRELCTSVSTEQRLRNAGAAHLSNHQPEFISQRYLEIIHGATAE